MALTLVIAFLGALFVGGGVWVISNHSDAEKTKNKEGEAHRE